MVGRELGLLVLFAQGIDAVTQRELGLVFCVII